MGTSPDRMRAEIDATRGRLSADVDRLADRASPRRVVRRRTRIMRGAVSGMRERVMGTASYTAHGVADGAQSAAGSLQDGTQQAAGAAREAAGQAGEAMRQAPDEAIRRTQGNPLAAGLIAFGTGLLASSLLPTSETEQQKAADLMARGGEVLEPVKEAALESAQHLKEGTVEAAQGAAQEVKDSAAEAARVTQDEAREQAGQVTDQARESGRQVAGEARNQPGSG
ncbi:DUF3618 domain-containing protein [Streptomyces sp. NPDC048481]|uniref:DUF3618 domain-containing protein n=1 Tax=Streptomyces sp. NPDC048481 TaxID=3365557 RepID=UPI0037105A97